MLLRTVQKHTRVCWSWRFSASESMFQFLSVTGHGLREDHWLLLRGLSLHLSHLIPSHMATNIGHLGHFLLEFFWSDVHIRDFNTYPWTYFGHFRNVSLYDDLRAIWVLFGKRVLAENERFLDEGAMITHPPTHPPSQFSFRRADI